MSHQETRQGYHAFEFYSPQIAQDVFGRFDCPPQIGPMSCRMAQVAVDTIAEIREEDCGAAVFLVEPVTPRDTETGQLLYAQTKGLPSVEVATGLSDSAVNFIYTTNLEAVQG